IREIRRDITAELEVKRRDGEIGSSLQAALALSLAPEDAKLLTPAEWAEISIVSLVAFDTATDSPTVHVSPAPGTKCVRCWRVLEEVGKQPGHPLLCERCADAVDRQ
ncbi:MAG TPA: zinc finger domain-containing protein, partial [Acetobacteraceae bacterium]|nr:zinc finger domain-containing protein [Acetobacteraceae bacterium]